MRSAGVILIALMTAPLPALERQATASMRDDASTPQQANAPQPVKIPRTGTERKIDSRLYLALLHHRNDPRVASLAEFRFLKPSAEDGRIAVDVLLSPDADIHAVLGALRSRGAVLKAQSDTFRTINTRIHLEDLEPLAAMPEVRRLRETVRAVTHPQTIPR